VSAGVAGVAIAALVLLSSCGQPVGTDCMITGSGFHARDPCAHKCLSRWRVNCPGGEGLLPNVCTGSGGCTPGSCPPGQACYSFDDPFEERSYCVPDDICGPLTGEQRQRWERNSAMAAARIRARFDAKRVWREDAPSTKAAQE